MFGFHGFGLIEQASVVWLILDWIIRIGALFFVPRNRKPSSATAWLLVIFLIPTLGLLFYLIIGSPKLPKSRREAQKTLDGFIAGSLKLFEEHDSTNMLSAEPPKKYTALAKLSQSLSHMPVFDGNHLDVMPDYEHVIDQLVKDISHAKSSVFMEYFIIKQDELTEPVFVALAAAVKRGVRVHVLYDSLSTRRFKGTNSMLKRLRTDGVQVQALLPFRLPGRGYVRPDLRNHRKIVVIDGEIGYTGSLNLIRRNYHRKDELYYDELVVRAHGPIALQLAAVFMTDWFSETGTILRNRNAPLLPRNIVSHGNSLAQILPSGPGYEDENNLKLFTSLIHTAQRRITITNPYFVPDDALTTALTSAAKRGVEVILINSEAMDQWMVGHAQRSFYEVLLKAGVKIYWYKAPILLHSKFMTVDDEVATIGSSNLDIRSFELNLEVTLISYDPKVVKKLRAVEATYLARCKHITLARWQNRPRIKVLIDNIARLTSAVQ
jgi:cardiolipin synthase